MAVRTSIHDHDKCISQVHIREPFCLFLMAVVAAAAEAAAAAAAEEAEESLYFDFLAARSSCIGLRILLREFDNTLQALVRAVERSIPESSETEPELALPSSTPAP